MFEPGQQDFGMLVQIVLDLHDGRDRPADIGAEEFQTDGAHLGWHAVQNETGRGNQAVAALLLHPRQAGEKFVGDVLTQTGLAEQGAGHL